MKIDAFYFLPFLKYAMPMMFGILGGIGRAIFGSDPGGQASRALQSFAKSGELFGEDIFEGAQGAITSGSALQSALARQSAGQRQARSGLTGSGIGEDLIGNIDMSSQESLSKALTNLRLQILQSRLSALGLASQTPRTPGLLESGAKLGASVLAGGGL